MPQPRVAILAAMPQELDAFQRLAGTGAWRGCRVDLALTGVGKVAAAAATQRMLDRGAPDAVVITGCAGSLDARRGIGDIGVATHAIDADLDVRAWRPGTRRGEQPFGGGRLWPGDPALVEAALSTPVPGIFAAFIATGSAFLDAAGKAAFIARVRPELADEAGRLPDLIEMEGSAVLQVCAAAGVPCVAIRAVSDGLSGDAVADFDAFLAGAIHRNALVVERVLDRMAAGR